MRLGVLLDVLGVKESVLAPVPPHLSLAVGVTGFWMREARPAPSLPQVQALLLGMVYGELAWNNQPGGSGCQHTGLSYSVLCVYLCLFLFLSVCQPACECI